MCVQLYGEFDSLMVIEFVQPKFFTLIKYVIGLKNIPLSRLTKSFVRHNFRRLQNIFLHFVSDIVFSDRVIYRQRAKVYALLYVIKNIIRIIDTNNPRIYCSIFTRINFLTNSYFNFSHKLLKS